MPFHTFDHKFNTKYQKDPAIEKWVYQRYYGQFAQFRINWRSMKWLTILYGVVPAGLFYWNESVVVHIESMDVK
jgi:hypothetical protein